MSTSCEFREYILYLYLYLYLNNPNTARAFDLMPPPRRAQTMTEENLESFKHLRTLCDERAVLEKVLPSAGLCASHHNRIVNGRGASYESCFTHAREFAC